MNIVETKDYVAMSEAVAHIVIDQLKRKPNSVLGLATGGTPKGTYDKLIQAYQKGIVSFAQATTFNLDEYVGLASSNENSYHYYMNKLFFSNIDIELDHCHIPNGVAMDLQAECNRYEQLIESSGGIDLQILGIGKNGHIGFNEPGTSFHSRTHVVDLAESTRKANARYFPHVDDVPTQAITAGIETIMQSDKVVLLISGNEKAKAFEQLMKGDIQESFPASVLRKHANVTIVADEQALQFVTKAKPLT
ncbi:glucosamine-6-phosphate deaminase [Alkalihalobacillus sp. LMS39]|uniref:glucosamine-6-phosphate deaminase n=1 Tax=Alkalihalobacillus sp. LMS39 TaxID=2924032 RepID=UPI001FB43539|nr:glucosamine-6-phosphate deaminase [Alkalihalobacillus sp. LMS39]UOE93770.1 glucosamine-6-phosphate deaminase [Alkalihalobacillus sp. LMS39]